MRGFAGQHSSIVSLVAMGLTKREKKEQYIERLREAFETYSKIMVVGIDNVSSNLMQKIRISLRGFGEIICGKNTLIRRGIQDLGLPGMASLVNVLKGNVALVFTNNDVSQMKEKIMENKTLGPARAGTIAPCDVIVPKGNTGLEPTMTSFMQALNIATKISRGSVEILNDVPLINKGDKVGHSEAALLQKLSILPFYFGMTPMHVFEGGSVYPASVLDITEDELLEDFGKGIAEVAALSMAISYPNVASISHMVGDAFKNIMAVALETSYTFPLADKMQGAIAAAASAPTATATGAAEEEAPAAAEEEEEEDDAVEGMGGLFDF
eukprot:gnl/Trimastix_PCT/12.p1 GENE.gnl/Trimastix_PCT/12~~gnl/Trimastix_PCT/12.p1  ORF type:complete len:325 (-),score=100.22 gnl/Trimastix_PCT/12:388-1362(-)